MQLPQVVAAREMLPAVPCATVLPALAGCGRLHGPPAGEGSRDGQDEAGRRSAERVARWPALGYMPLKGKR